jgi:hypothetical protein
VLDIRRVVEGLRPPALDELGLAGACTQAVTRLTAEGGVAVVIDAEDQLPVLPAAVEVAAYRIVVEAVTNIVRHASASHCSVSLTASSAQVTHDRWLRDVPCSARLTHGPPEPTGTTPITRSAVAPAFLHHEGVPQCWHPPILGESV